MMKLYRSILVVIFVSTLFSVSCGKTSVPSSSSAGALTANSAFYDLVGRPFGRHILNAAGANYLNEFMLPEIRARLDEEPVGNTDSDYDPSTMDQGTSSEEPQAEPAAEGQNEDAQDQPADGDEESYPAGSRLDTLKFSWAKKAFGDAVKASPTNNGVVVLYADENYYDVERLMGFVEDGRNRIAETSGIQGDRIQVVFGGYRAVPQVELWVVPLGSPMPEFKADDRSKPEKAEN